MNVETAPGSEVETAGQTERPTRSTHRARARRRNQTRTLRAQLPSLALIPLCLAWVYPFIWMVSGSVKPPAEFFSNGLSLVARHPTTANFSRAWSLGSFGTYFINTVIISVAVVVIVVLVSSMAGLALGRGHMPGRKLIVGGLVLTMFLPHGYTIIPVFVLVNALHLNNTLVGVVLAESGPAHIVSILLFMGFFAKLPAEIEEAAIMDGTGYVKMYVRIFMPMARPVIGTVVLFTFIEAWNAFFIPLVFTLAAPNLRTLGVGVYVFFGQYGTDWGAIAAASVISVIPMIIVFLFVQKTFVEGIAGAIKG